MLQQVHILNGDALRNQFPEELKGEIIVVRECLMDGNVEGENLEDFFQNRAEFISGAFETGSVQQYYSKTVSEFEKIQSIPKEASINLWFEDDLFCQVHFWFVVHLLVAPDLIATSKTGYGDLQVKRLLAEINRDLT